MSKFLLTAAAAAIAISASVAMGSTPSQAAGARYCISGYQGGSIENCNFATFRACQATTSGTSGSCVLNPGYEGEGYAYGSSGDAYAYDPGPGYAPRRAYGPGYGYGPRYERPGVGFYFGGF